MAKAFPGIARSTSAGVSVEPPVVDLQRRRDHVNAKVAELQWDLGGLVYEMATRDHIRVEVLIRRAAELQHFDAELAELDRILAMERSGIADICAACSAPHSSGASYCWQCGHQILRQVDTDSIFAEAEAESQAEAEAEAAEAEADAKYEVEYE